MVQTRRKKYKVAKKTAEPVKSKKPSKWTSVPTDSIRITRAMATASPRQAVFDTAEILEHILLNLPTRTLWACQRVCKQFQAITETSPILQEEMMLQPSGSTRQCWRLENRDWVADPFERGRWVVHRDGDEIPPIDYTFPSLRTRASLWTPARLCPLLSVNSGWHQQAQTNSAFRVGGQRGEHVRFNCSSTIMSNPGSWENILMTDPPCFEAEVTLRFTIGHYGIPDGTLHLHRKVENPEGLRFGDLILGVLRMPGWVSWSMHGKQYHRVYQRPDKRLAKMEEQLGVKALLHAGHGNAATWTRIWLKSVVIPAEEEWNTVK